MRTNYVGPALLMGVLAERFEGVAAGPWSASARSRVIAGVPRSAARPRRDSRRSCPACASGIHVVTVKSGFVRTRVTDGMDLPARLTPTPEEVAAAVVRAVRRRRDVVYVRRVRCPIILFIRAVPERLFKRLRL